MNIVPYLVAGLLFDLFVQLLGAVGLLAHRMKLTQLLPVVLALLLGALLLWLTLAWLLDAITLSAADVE